jgi:hypothetical protein
MKVYHLQEDEFEVRDAKLVALMSVGDVHAEALTDFTAGAVHTRHVQGEATIPLFAPDRAEAAVRYEQGYGYKLLVTAGPFAGYFGYVWIRGQA